MAEPRADEGRPRRWRPFLITLVLVAGAALAVWFLWHQYMHTLWTRDARVRAAVIQVAPHGIVPGRGEKAAVEPFPAL